MTPPHSNLEWGVAWYWTTCRSWGPPSWHYVDTYTCSFLFQGVEEVEIPDAVVSGSSVKPPQASKTYTQPNPSGTLAPPRPNIDGLEPPAWDRHVDFRIICVVFDRAQSLERLLKSLNTVDYMGAKVLVEVWIDRSKKDDSIDANTYITASRFKFEHGDIRVNNHTRHVGIYGQWLATWKPAPDSKEIAVILEDDISVSPFLWRWLKNAHAKYDGRKEIAGYSLQGRSMKHNGAPGNLKAPPGHFCMLYAVVGRFTYIKSSYKG